MLYEVITLQDGQRILGSRIVGGQHRHIRMTAYGFGHQRPLAAVTVAAAAKYGDDAFKPHPAKGGEDVLQRIRGMGIINKGMDALVVGHTLEPSRNPVEIFQSYNFV